ncbi:MAG TPA: hypothetical protein VGI58_04270 [Streptosporangiaceae bacterium]|jgi:hypothetical protein
MSAASAATVAIAFVWLGMVAAISFLEAPLKFRASGVTLQVGLGIGRLVFRALNTVEVILAAAILATLVAASPSAGATVAIVAAVAMLGAQLVLVRPSLTRRSNAVLAGQDAPRSNAHYAYLGLETAKVIALIVGGILLLAS